MEKIRLHKRLLAGTVFKKILYLGPKNYLIYRDGRVEETGSDFRGNIPLVVLGRKYYFESLKSFPISNLKEIRSAVKTDIASFSPFPTDRFFVKKIGHTDDSTRVNLWFVNRKFEVDVRLRSPFFLIPETALLSYIDERFPRIYAIHQYGEQSLAVCIDKDRGIKSMTLQADGVDLVSFRRFIGPGAQDCPHRDIVKLEEYLALFPAILYNMPLPGFRDFVNQDLFSFGFDKARLGIGLAVTACLFFLYTGLSTSLLYVEEKSLQEEDKTLSQNLAGLLKKQEQVDAHRKRQIELAEILNRYTYKLPLINLLGQRLPPDTTIHRMTVSGNRVEIRGTVPRASELLSSLSRSAEVKGARFSSPLREDKKTGMEQFVLTFSFER
jgi:hypothetical protein